MTQDPRGSGLKAEERESKCRGGLSRSRLCRDERLFDSIPHSSPRMTAKSRRTLDLNRSFRTPFQ